MLKKICLINIIIVIATIIELSATAINYSIQQMWPVLEQPWYFCEPTSITIDKKGVIYIADTCNNRIRKFSTNGQFITHWGQLGDKEGEFYLPHGIAVDSTGYVYVADTQNHRIQKFSSDGQFMCSWGNLGNEKGQFRKPYGITISPDNYVYVSDTYNNRIQMFSTNGDFLYQWKVPIFYPYGITSDVNGNIFIVDSRNKQIQKIMNKQTISIFPLNNIQLKLPKDITIDAENNIYLTDRGNNRIVKINANGDILGEWNSENTTNAIFDSLYGIALDPKGYLFVSDTENQCIQKFTLEGQFISRWGSGISNGKFNLPHGISVGQNNKVYVADSMNNRIQKFSLNGEFETAWGDTGNLTGLFNYPFDLTTDFSNYEQSVVFVSDEVNSRIQLFTENGQFIEQWGDDVLERPKGIDTDNNGNLYVVSYGNHKIYQFDTKGFVTSEWGGKGAENGLFSWPNDVACDRRNSDQLYIYVTDTSNHRIQKFSSMGQYITQWGSEGKDPGEFYFPTSIAVDNEGLVYVTDMETYRIQVFQPDGTFITQWGEGGYHPGQLNDPTGLAIGPEDTIYVADTFNHRIQVFQKEKLLTKKSQRKGIVNSINSETLQDKAIIIAGGGPYPGNDLWDATQLNANYAYQVLIYNGFAKSNILYLSQDQDLDLDGNGKFDDIDNIPENTNLENAIKIWASDANQLFIYFVDHGGKDRFRMSHKEMLSAELLDQWLDELQSLFSVKTFIIYDACQSGSFLPSLIPPAFHDRIVISSTNENESAYFLSMGYLSFSYNFWTRIFMGNNLFQAFTEATSRLDLNQHPQIDDNNDGIYTVDDGVFAQDTTVGISPIIFDDAPVIVSISDHQTITQGAKTSICVYSVTDNDNISRVWAVIKQQGAITDIPAQPVNALPEIDLMPVTKGVYEGEYARFSNSGTYQIIIYATDEYGNISLPAQTSVTVKNTAPPQAMIIAGDATSFDMQDAIEKNAHLAYQALKVQGFSDDTIYYEGPEWLNGIDDIASLRTIQYAIESIKSEHPESFILYITGQGDSGIFDINSAEILDAKLLDQWLDEFQTNNQTTITMIYDASMSGSFLPILKPDQTQERILITGSSANQPAHFLVQGAISFSQFFWRSVFNGMTIRDAFTNGQSGVDFSCNIQNPQLDDNGNGIGNDFSDGLISMQRTIGSGIRLAENTPSIGTTKEFLNITQTHANITATHVTATDRIEQMIAVITPPCAAYTGSMMVVTETPTNEVDHSYTFNAGSLDCSGEYQVTMYAVDKYGNISKPSATRLLTSQALLDEYEPDNTLQNATVLQLNDQNPYHHQIKGYEWQQQHNFYNEADVDWFTFKAVQGEIYQLKVEYTPVEPNISVFTSNSKEITDVTITNNDNILYADFTASYSDVYYVQLQPNEEFIIENNLLSYQISLSLPAGSFNGFIFGSITPIVEQTIIYTTGNQSVMALPNGMFFLPHSAGSFTLRVEANDFDLFEKHIIVNEIEPLKINIPLKSIYPCPVAKFFPENTLISDPPLSVQFSDQSEGHIAEWTWNFGDGLFSSERNIEHLYQYSGIYNVVLTVKGPGGSARIVRENMVIVKAQDTDNDTMPDDWEIQYGLDPYKNDALLDLDGDGLSNAEEYNLNTRPDNSRPEQPILHISNSLRLYTESFSDPDISDDHTKSHWQISPYSTFTVNTIDIIDKLSLLSYTFTNLVLDSDTEYFARVQFVDNYNGLSQWSNIVMFTTPVLYIDNNNNNIPDNQEVNDSLLDLDDNDIADIYQSDIQLFKTLKSNIVVGIHWDNAKVIFQSVLSEDSSAVTNSVNRPSNAPYGIFRLKFNLMDNIKNNTTVTMYFENPLSVWTKLYGYDDIHLWQDLSDYTEINKNKVTFSMQDGGIGDADQTQNGVIINILEVEDIKPYDKLKDRENDVGSCFISICL